MKKSLTLSIAKPCGENWNSFTPTDTGGFCSSCSKNVIDFTHASEADILNFFTHQPIHVCARFRADQLKTYPLIASGSIKPGFVLLRAGLLSLLLLLIGKPVSSQTPIGKTPIEIVQYPQHDTAETRTQKQMRITGIVTSAEDGSPLSGVSVVIKGTAIGILTDGNGKFEIDVEPGSTLFFSFIGLVTVQFPINDQIKQISIAMEPDEVTLGEVVWMGEVNTKDPYTEKTGFFGRVWTKIKNVL